MTSARRIDTTTTGGEERNPREDRILEAAADLLVRYGYRKTTLDDVAREAGVGKGTIYLHWKDKNELFLAAIWRASDQTIAEALRKMRADPEGWRFHRFFSHGVLALLANPLMAALVRGRRDIFQGFMDALDPGTIRGLIGNSVEHIIKLQAAGVIRSDLPVSLITYLIGSLEVGLIYVPDVAGADFTPSAEQLTDGLSDLVQRWLEPDQPPEDIQVAKNIMSDWIENISKIANSGQ